MKMPVNDPIRKKELLEQYQRVTVIGAGDVGISWTALFLANGLKVTVTDPRPDVEDATWKGINAMKPALKERGYKLRNIKKNIFFEKDLGAAICNADLIQENGPENVLFKQDLYVQIERNVKPAALVLSSSSGIPTTVFSAKMKAASRVLVGHPFNPSHLIPLVEVVPGSRTCKEAVAEAVAFYTAIGKKPIVIDREISGFVANRLQAALMRESTYLVSIGVVSMEKLDQIVSNSIGLRWAAAGPFKTFTLGGGPGGLPHFLKHRGPGLENLWKVLGDPRLDPSTNKILIQQFNNGYSKIPYEELAKEQDQQQLAILHALGKKDV